MVAWEVSTVVCPNKHPPPSENLAYWGGGALPNIGDLMLIRENAFNFPRRVFFPLRRHPLSRSSSPSRNTERWINPCIPTVLPVHTLATMGKSYGRDALPKTVALGKQQATLQNFFRPKAPPIFRTPEPVAPPAAALVHPEPEVDPMVADAQWLLNLGGNLPDDSVVMVEDTNNDEAIDVDAPVEEQSALCEVLDPDLHKEVEAYVAHEDSVRRHVWTPEEKTMVMRIWERKKKSINGSKPQMSFQGFFSCPFHII